MRARMSLSRSLFALVVVSFALGACKERDSGGPQGTAANDSTHGDTTTGDSTSVDPTGGDPTTSTDPGTPISAITDPESEPHQVQLGTELIVRGSTA